MDDMDDMDDIDAYMAALPESEQQTLTKLRSDIHDLLPDAEECISYGMPTFKVHGKAVAGFAAFKNHLSYFPFSGTVLASLADDIDGYQHTKSSLHFPVGEPLPRPLLRKLIKTRLAQLPPR